MEKTIAFVTLGCKLNFSETSTIARQFAEAGYKQVPESKKADIYVINTCSVTEHADKKCRNIIRRLHKISPEAEIVVTGCYAQLKPQEIIKIEGVSAVLGAGIKGDLFGITQGLKNASAKIYSCNINKVSDIFPAYSSGERTRSFLKVQDGCDYHCSYCTVPLARGKSRNLPISVILRQAHEIAASGIKEVVITGVNTGDFGKTTGEDFYSLLKYLNNVNGIERYRISSIEPNLLSEQIIDWIASDSKFLPHFHIPLQSGCDKILASMKRRYNTKTFENKINLIRKKINKPYAENYVFLGIDVIVGFPGETDDDFECTYSFLEKIRPSFIHIFPYSRREGTPAALMENQVKDSVKTARVEMLEKLNNRLYLEFCESNRGREEEVLFESTFKGGMMFGYTRNYIRVERPYDESLIGKIVKISLP